MSLIITDDCINCDVCEPECPNAAIASAITMSRNASKCARLTASRWMKPTRKPKNS